MLIEDRAQGVENRNNGNLEDLDDFISYKYFDSGGNWKYGKALEGFSTLFCSFKSVRIQLIFYVLFADEAEYFKVILRRMIGISYFSLAARLGKSILRGPLLPC